MRKQGYSPLSGAYYSAHLAIGEYLARVIVLRTRRTRFPF